jgi:hypothetical protein
MKAKYEAEQENAKVAVAANPTTIRNALFGEGKKAKT